MIPFSLEVTIAVYIWVTIYRKTCGIGTAQSLLKFIAYWWDVLFFVKQI